MKLLVESEADVIESTIDDTSSEKTYTIEGVFATIGVRNKNGRLYPKHIWEQAVAEFQEKIKNNSIECLGEWQHPYSIEIDPIKSVIKITDLRIQGNKVIGKAKVLNNKSNDIINQIKTLIDEKLPLSISSRGVGDVNENKEVTRFKLITFDLVSSPSDVNANNLKGVKESLNENYDVVDGRIIVSEAKPNVSLNENSTIDTTDVRNSIINTINNL